MRKAGTLPDPRLARRFADHLLTLGIAAHADDDGDGKGETAVWVEESAELERAQAELATFRGAPDDARYRRSEDAARDLRAEQERAEERARRNFVDVRRQWSAPPRQARLTIGLIAASVAVAFLSQLGAKPEPVFRYLAIALGPVLHGEVWRLVTPIFMHMSLPHILFNMLWLWDLGGIIESRKGMARFALLVLVIAVLSNLAQYLLSGPRFGGMSGVVYGLFGYVWMKGRYRPEEGMALHPQTVGWMLVWLVLCMTGRLGPIANGAHVAGLVSGAAIGWVTSFRGGAPPRA